MFADGAGISLSIHVPASSEGERRDLGKPRINYSINIPQCICLQEHDVDIRTYSRVYFLSIKFIFNGIIFRYSRNM